MSINTAQSLAVTILSFLLVRFFKIPPLDATFLSTGLGLLVLASNSIIKKITELKSTLENLKSQISGLRTDYQQDNMRINDRIDNLYGNKFEKESDTELVQSDNNLSTSGSPTIFQVEPGIQQINRSLGNETK